METTDDPAIDRRLRSFRADLRILEREIASALQDQGECCGVTPAQCHVLLELDGAGCINLTGLVGRLELDKSTLSRTVDGLVMAGLVDRSSDPANRRQQVICLSSAGKTRVAGIHRLCDANYSRLFDLVPEAAHDQIRESVKLLAGALQQLRRGIKNDNDTDGPGTCCR